MYNSRYTFENAAPPKKSGIMNSPAKSELDQLLASFSQQRYQVAKAMALDLTGRFPEHGFTWKALGAIYRKLGEQDKAIEALDKAARYLTQDPDVRYNLGNCYLEQNQLDRAEAAYRSALILQPGYVAAHYHLGKVYQQRDDLNEAETCYRLALSLQPKFSEALSSLGIVLHASGRIVESELSLRQALSLNPDNPLNYVNLANVQLALGKLTEAESAYRQALALAPTQWQAWFNLGNLLSNQKRYAEAESAFVQAVQLNRTNHEIWKHLGDNMLEQRRLAEAETCYREALSINPDYASAHNHLGIILRETERLDEAESSYRKAITLNPEYVEAHNNLGNTLREADRISEAEACYQAALELNPEYAEAHSNLGIALKTAGRLEEAKSWFKSAIKLNPEFLEPHYGIATLKTYQAQDPHIELLEKHLPTVAVLPTEAQIRYWFAVGKMYEDIGRYAESFDAYQQGNALKFSGLSWDEKKEVEFMTQMKTVFSKSLFDSLRAGHSDVRSPERTPIFIVGMPRSGTTLLEQILSTHPGVFGAGELLTMHEVISLAMPAQDYQQYPSAVPQLTAQRLEQLGQEYLDKVWLLSPQSSYITDKMPSNFLHIGMMHLMFPNAKIIHAMRDPMDSCFSCFSRLFNKNNIAFSYNLTALGNYYNRYIELMQHWHRILPPGTILECRYEDMVENTESQARRVLEYVGLPWDEKCLDFHQNKRRVKTASQAQVQKPIYKTSVARWKHYENFLTPLLDIVGQYR